MENNNQNTNQQPTTQPADSGDQGGRLFTQEDVDRIVRDRLNRSKNKAPDQDPAQLAEKETTLSEREASLIARESRLSCREYLAEKNYPVSLLDVVDTSNYEEFKKRVDIAAELIRTPNPYDESGPMYQPFFNQESCVKKMDTDGFSPNIKHTPRPY